MMSDPVLKPLPAPAQSPADEAGCSEFEATLGLLDGLLQGESLLKAQAHADACLLCGPMVREWAGVGAKIEEHFFLAAESAKPDLSGLADRVLKQVAPAKAPAKKSVGARLGDLLKLLQAPFALTAAACAIFLVAGPLVGGRPGAGVSPLEQMAEREDQANAADEAPAPGAADPNDCHVHKLAFEGGDGMVLQTPVDGMTVIWVTENEGA